MLLVLHHLVVRGVADFARRPFHESEHDLLVRLGLHGAAKVGDLAIGHFVAPSFDDAQRAGSP